jgi:hypothetical protein
MLRGRSAIRGELATSPEAHCDEGRPARHAGTSLARALPREIRMGAIDTRHAPASGLAPVAHRSRSVPAASFWMVVITLALFFLPLINGLVGGFVGGYMVGTVGRALAAAVLPAGVAAVGLWALFALFDAPLVGLFAGSAVALLVLVADVGLFVGAVLGALFSPGRPRPRALTD